MKFAKTTLQDAYVLNIEEKSDKRGFLGRVFCIDEFLQQGIKFRPVQANLSFNRHKHTLRGLHYQAKPYEEAKLVYCTKGKIYDVIIDLREASTTYLKWEGFELSDINRRILYVPEGFAHGFLTLKDKTEVSYLMSEFYAPGAGKGIRWNDPAFKVAWPAEVAVISNKDANWPLFATQEGSNVI